MRSTFALLLSLCGPVFAAPAPASSAIAVRLKAIFERAVGDQCKAPEGTGSCQSTSNCNGISYPTGLCPKDPKDVQCCVEIKCNAPYGGNFCRSVKNNGCSGGEFKSGYCPGSTDIKCCVKDAAPKCRAPYGSSDCRSVSREGCSGGTFKPGFCPGSTDIQCCVKESTPKCNAPYSTSDCRSVSKDGCSGGTFKPGFCPGSTDNQCCVKNSPSPPPVQSPTEWPNCQRTLSCTFGQIATASMQARLDYVKLMQSNFFGPLNGNDQYRAIEGVITFFIRRNLGAPQSWVSYVDAGIVEAIQRGGAIALGLSTNDGGNPGSAYWARFLENMKRDSFSGRDAHDAAWGQAEQISTDYGRDKANAKFPVSQREVNWYFTTQLFREIMRNRGSWKRFLGEPLVNWLTDIRDSKPADCLSEAGWVFAGQIDGPPTLSDVAELVTIFDALRICFTKG